MFFLPGFHYFRRWRHASACGPMLEMSASGGEPGGGASFGVRRPLRFLAWKLELDESGI